MQYINQLAVDGISKKEQDEVKRLLKRMRTNVARAEVAPRSKPRK
jgi:hypothetical protein